MTLCGSPEIDFCDTCPTHTPDTCPYYDESVRFVNLTPHTIDLNDGRSFEPKGPAARVKASFSEFDADLVCTQKFGEIENLPPPVERTRYIVSGLVLSAAKAAGRGDCVAPATGHPDTVRNEKGHIVSVPGFVE